jgi:glycosyltransferase involved in cell wall biosynthesis
MYVSGFTFVRNACKYDYPVVASINSLLPLCDEIVVSVGQSDDETMALIQSIDSPKVRIIESIWDDAMREGGRVLAVETDKAYRAISPLADWCIYLQADEVIHEADYPAIRLGMERWLDKPEVEALLCSYKHFCVSYDYRATSSKWYSHEIRILRHIHDVYSYRDAQGFRRGDNQKLHVKPIHAHIYHYGRVKNPQAMRMKQTDFDRLWHDDTWLETHRATREETGYTHGDALVKYSGSHPAVMRDRISAYVCQLDYDPTAKGLSIKDRLKYMLRDYLGINLSYRSYIHT